MQLELDTWVPDFTALSFYKIFGFPDLGALIGKKSATHLLGRKRSLASRIVDIVTDFSPDPMLMRRGSIDEQLEEGASIAFPQNNRAWPCD